MSARESQVDVVVVGLGPGGEYAAQKLAEAGLDVVGVERGLVGGECPFYGCIPSKMIIRAANTLAEARRADDARRAVDVRPDWRLVAERIDRQATNDWDDASHAERLEAAGVRIVRGDGRLDGPGVVVVGDERFVARRGVVLNAGTSPATLPVDGLADTPYWTNREVVKVRDLPGEPDRDRRWADRRGAGAGLRPVRHPGDRARGGRPDPGPGGAGGLRARRRGLRARGHRRAHRGADRPGRATTGVSACTSGTGRRSRATQLLVAAGRRTNLAGLGLETVGLDPEARAVETDERMRAGERLWAVGDITGKGPFTHVSMYQGAVAVRDLLGEDGPWADYRAVSHVTFTDPEVGSVGMTEQAPATRGSTSGSAAADLPESSRGWIHQAGNDGLVKLVADRERGVLVGGTTVGPLGRARCWGWSRPRCTPRCRSRRCAAMHFAYPTFHRALEVALDQIEA